MRRAAHLHVDGSSSLTTDSYTNALRRFIAEVKYRKFAQKIGKTYTLIQRLECITDL